MSFIIRHSARSSAFTLLEIMLAVAILSMIGTVIYRFTDTTLQATRVTAREADIQSACAGLTHLLQAQLDALPSGYTGALAGSSRKDGEGQADDLTLICSSPAALLSRAADRPWRIQISLRPTAAGSGSRANAAGGRRTLGMTRLAPAQDQSANNLAPAGFPTGAGPVGEGVWIPLLDGVNSLEMTYFNKQLNGWLPKWNDTNNLPDLVRLRLGFLDGRAPYEVVLRIPPRTRQQALAVPAAATPAPGTPGVPGGANPAPANPNQRRTTLTR